MLDKVAVLSLYVAPALKGRCSCCVCPSVAVLVICLRDALFCGKDLCLRSGREEQGEGEHPIVGSDPSGSSGRVLVFDSKLPALPLAWWSWVMSERLSVSLSCDTSPIC